MDESGNSIIEIRNGSLEPSAEIIRKAFGAVTEELGITEENSPRFPAYKTVAELNEKRDRGAEIFGAFIKDKQVGVVVVELEEGHGYFAKRLAVLPEFWHRGIGEKLMIQAIKCVKGYGAEKLNIAIVNEHTVLKDWYIAMGFRQVEVKTLDFLPFKVGFLEKKIS